MLFSSFTFLIKFLPLVLIIYFLAPNRTIKNLVLLLSSLLFYAWGEPIYVILIIISTVSDYTLSLLIEKYDKLRKYKIKKIVFIISIVINLSLLGVFKYSNFIFENLELIGIFIPHKKLALPIGISFYTFQTMSYTIDVYNKNVKAQKNFLNMATYVSLFPQLIAGPIVRYITIAEELDNRKESIDLFVKGISRFILGLGKKVIIANSMGFIADTIINKGFSQAPTILIWLAMISYTFQIYFDFSGYSDMAIGLGKIFGFNFLENFNYPYISTSITEFWRRWHISLSTWFRDYLYIPLGGNKKHHLRNIFIVWLLTGLWHGASWNYIIWGLYYCIFLLIEKSLNKTQIKIPTIIKYILTMFIVIIGWTIFRIENLSHLMGFLTRMFSYKRLEIEQLLTTYNTILPKLIYVFFALIGSTPIIKKMYKYTLKTFPLIAHLYIAIIYIISMIFLSGSTFNPFIYFRF